MESLEKKFACIHNLIKKPATYIARKTPNRVWCNIHKSVKALENFGVNNQQLFQLIPGSEEKILFWKDTWCGSNSSQQNFPNLYRLDSTKCCLLTTRLSANGLSWRWNHAPSTPIEFHKLLQLYKDFGELDILKASSPYGICFSLTTNGSYFIGRKRCL